MWFEAVARPPRRRRPLLASDRLEAASRWRSLPLAMLLAVAGLLLSLWAFSVPLGEGPDEPDHITYAAYIHIHHSLPPYNSRYVEGNEPPLYYAAVAPFIDGDFVTVPDARPGANGHPVLAHPPAQWLHSDHEVARYPRLYAARVLTIAVSLLGVLFTYLAALELASRRSEALLAACLVGLLPEFSFRAMNISCDALVLTLSAGATWAIVRLFRRGFSWRRGIVAAALVGLAALSKLTGLALLPTLLLAVALEARLPVRRRLAHLSVLAVVPAVLAPWLLRNQRLYGDPFAARALAAAVPGQIVHHQLLSGYFIGPFPTLVVESFLARFGWMNLGVPLPVLGALLVPWLVGVTALPWALRRHAEQRRLLLLLLAAPATALLALVGFNLTVFQAQGRYLFPALPAMAVAVAMLYRHVPGWVGHRRLLLPAGAAALALLNLGILVLVVRPAYGL